MEPRLRQEDRIQRRRRDGLRPNHHQRDPGDPGVDSYLFQQSGSISEGNGAIPTTPSRTTRVLDKNTNISTVTCHPAYYAEGALPAVRRRRCAVMAFRLGSAFNETIDPSLKTPYSIALNAGMQTQFPGDMVMKLSYAGRLGRRLLAQATPTRSSSSPIPPPASSTRRPSRQSPTSSGPESSRKCHAPAMV